jgi:hypothetical protein
VLPGLPASPAAVLRAALAAAGLPGDPYLRGAALAGWTPDGGLLVATVAPVPPAPAARLLPRLTRGLASVLGRPVPVTLVPWATLDAAPGEGRE